MLRNVMADVLVSGFRTQVLEWRQEGQEGRERRRANGGSFHAWAASAARADIDKPEFDPQLG
jgi:hypothetical protein